jgi:hypothetical protein
MTRIGLVALAGAMLASLSGVASGQTAHIDFAEVVSFGYSGAGTQLPQGPIRRNITHTPVRAVAVGTTFSMKVRILGKPDGADVALRFVFRAPRPGMKDAKTGALIREDAEDMKAKIGGEVERTFEFKEQAQIVRGTWRAEVWNGQRRIAMRRFAVQ